MEWVETTAKTVDAAKDAALDRLGVAADEAEFEVLEEPRPGLFGRTRGEARVRAPNTADTGTPQTGAPPARVQRQGPCKVDRAQQLGLVEQVQRNTRRGRGILDRRSPSPERQRTTCVDEEPRRSIKQQEPGEDHEQRRARALPRLTPGSW